MPLKFRLRESPPFFKHALPWELKSLLALLGAFAVLVGFVAAAVAGFFFWAMLTG
jgi:hypothetical protein